MKLIFLLILLAPNFCFANDKFSASANASIFTDYIFRGVNRFEGLSIQPSVGTTYTFSEGQAINASVWSHFSAETGDGPSRDFSELDFTTFYDYQLGRTNISVGNTFYSFSNDSFEDTGEVFVSAFIDFTLQPTLSWYYDYNAYDAHYYELAFSHPIIWPGFGEGFSIAPFVTFGFASSADKIYKDDGLVHTTFGVYFESLWGNLIVTPSLSYTAESDDAVSDELWFGVSILIPLTE